MPALSGCPHPWVAPRWGSRGAAGSRVLSKQRVGSTSRDVPEPFWLGTRPSVGTETVPQHQAAAPRLRQPWEQQGKTMLSPWHDCWLQHTSCPGPRGQGVGTSQQDMAQAKGKRTWPPGSPGAGFSEGAGPTLRRCSPAAETGAPAGAGTGRSEVRAACRSPVGRACSAGLGGKLRVSQRAACQLEALGWICPGSQAAASRLPCSPAAAPLGRATRGFLNPCTLRAAGFWEAPRATPVLLLQAPRGSCSCLASLDLAWSFGPPVL